MLTKSITRVQRSNRSNQIILCFRATHPGRPKLKIGQMTNSLDKYIAPEVEVVILSIEAAVMGASDGVADWGGEGAGDEQNPGF